MTIITPSALFNPSAPAISVEPLRSTDGYVVKDGDVIEWVPGHKIVIPNQSVQFQLRPINNWADVVAGIPAPTDPLDENGKLTKTGGAAVINMLPASGSEVIYVEHDAAGDETKIYASDSSGIRLQRSQMATAVDEAINAETVNRLTWHLSALGFTGTAEAQLVSALAAMNTVVAPTAHKKLIVDLDIDLSAALSINVPNIVIEAANRRTTEITTTTLAFGSIPHFILISAPSVTLQGFKIFSNGACSSSVVRTQNTDTQILDNDISNIDVDTVLANNANNVGSVLGVNIANVLGSDITKNALVKNNNIHDVATCIAGVNCGTGIKIRENTVSNYSKRGMYFTGNTVSKLSVIDNDFQLPANVALTTANGALSTGAIKQPFAVQRTVGQLLDITFTLNRYHGNGLPFRNSNPIDSPGDNTDIPDQSVADVFSFHACTGIISVNNVVGGGEVGIAVANHCEKLSVLANTINGTDTSGIFVGGTIEEESSRDVTVSGNVIYDCCLDKSGDHSSAIAGIHFSSGLRLIAVGNSVINSNDRPPSWDINTSYAVGDIVVFPFETSQIASQSGLKTWANAAAVEFIPEFVFRSNSDLYKVPTSFVGAKGASLDATELARYENIGTLNSLGPKGEYRSYTAVQDSTGIFPAFDIDGSHWSPSTQSVSASAVYIFDCEETVESGNVGVNLLIKDNTTRTSGTNTFIQTDGIKKVLNASGLPVMSASAELNGNARIYDESVGRYQSYRNGGWQLEDAGITKWAAYTNVTGAQFVDYSNVAGVTVTNTNEYLFDLSEDLPALNYPVAISSYDNIVKTYRVSTPALNQILVQVFNSNGTIATNSNFTIFSVA